MKLEVTKKVGKKVDSSGPDPNKVNLGVMLKVHQIDEYTEGKTKERH